MNKQQLAGMIWRAANNLRGKIEANEYKDHILGLIFYKFLSDKERKFVEKNFTEYSGEEKRDMMRKCLTLEEGNEDARCFMEYCQANIGYFIEYKHLYSTWLLPDGDFSVSVLSSALGAFERHVDEIYRSVYGGIFRSLETGLSKLGDNPTAQTGALRELLALIRDIPTDGTQDYDVLGYVYEYLIGNFAANAGKKAGEFYTPHEVAILMSEIVADHHKGKDRLDIYDPTSGSGSLLITIGKSVGRHIASKDNVRYYAQELKENTYNLTRMNLVMRGIGAGNIHTRCADSLREDWPTEEVKGGYGKPLYVDAVVSNPPYSQRWDNAFQENDPRFSSYGVAPKSKADYAFLLHELYHLKPDGILTIVLPHGVLFRGGEEEKIRSTLIEKNNIDVIIGLPAGIFFGTGIPTLIMVLKQHREEDDVLFIDASHGFVKAGKQNKLRACDIRRITDTIRERKETHRFSRRVSRDEIRQNGYNLNIPRYVDSSDPVVRYDIYATVFGGIPEAEIDDLRPYWEAFPSLREDLFQPAGGKPYASLKVTDVREAISRHPAVVAFNSQIERAFSGFDDYLHRLLIDEVRTVRELHAEDEITADIFRRLSDIPLVDQYAAYQALADRWPDIIGDIETIQEEEGLEAARKVEMGYKLVKRGDIEVEVPCGLKGKIIPFDLVQKVRFQKELDAIAQLEVRMETAKGELEELFDGFTEEEHEAYYDSEKEGVIDKKKIKDDAKNGIDIDPETMAKLKQIVGLWDKQARLSTKIKMSKSDLEEKTKDTITHLSDKEIGEFLHLKWVVPVCEGIKDSLAHVVSSLQTAVMALGEKYRLSYEEISVEIDKTNDELNRMVGELTGDEFSLKGLEALFSGIFDVKEDER